MKEEITLQDVQMVEDLIKKYDGEFTLKELWKKLKQEDDGEK